MGAFDLKQFEKIAEDDDTATLRHPKGHTIVIAVKAIPKIQREAIKRLKLSEGGGISEQGKDVREANRLKKKYNDVEGAKESMEFAKAEQKGRAGEEQYTVRPKLKGLANGGKVQNYEKGADPVEKKDEGNDIEKDFDNLPDDSRPPAPPVNQQLYPNMSPPPEEGEGFSKDALSQPAGIGIDKTPDENSMLNNDQTANVPQAVKLGQKAAEQNAVIEADKARFQAANTDLAARERFAAAQKDQSNIDELANHTDQFKQYMASHDWGMNENKYLDERGSGQKIANAIGLFFGGLSVPFGGHNYAQDFMDKQIDRNIAAQKQRSENQKTVWGAYKDLYGDENIANSLTKISIRDQQELRAQRFAAQLGTPQAVQKLNQLKAENLIKNRQDLQDAAFIKGALDKQKGGGQGGAEQLKYRPPEDKKWGDDDVTPGSGQVPKTNAPPQVNLNYDRMNRSQMLGAKGVPGEISPGEVGAVNQAADLANSTNQAVKEVHNQMAEMWKNSDPKQLTDATDYIAHQGLGGLSLPDMRNWTPQSKRYFTAASAITKQIANVMKGGGSDELYTLIKNQLVRGNDKPSDYRKKLENLDNIMRQQLNTSVLKKYKLADGLPE